MARGRLKRSGQCERMYALTYKTSHSARAGRGRGSRSSAGTSDIAHLTTTAPDAVDGTVHPAAQLGPETCRTTLTAPIRGTAARRASDSNPAGMRQLLAGGRTAKVGLGPGRGTARRAGVGRRRQGRRPLLPAHLSAAHASALLLGRTA